MRVLVDTQCWLWMSLAPERLSARARTVVGSHKNTLYLSAASAWEIAIKHALGKLRLPEAPVSYVPDRMQVMGVQALSIAPRHALHVTTLPPHHRDPFDRLLVAQAQLEDLTIVTADAAIAKYDVEVIAA